MTSHDDDHPTQVIPTLRPTEPERPQQSDTSSASAEEQRVGALARGKRAFGDRLSRAAAASAEEAALQQADAPTIDRAGATVAEPLADPSDDAGRGGAGVAPGGPPGAGVPPNAGPPLGAGILPDREVAPDTARPAPAAQPSATSDHAKHGQALERRPNRAPAPAPRGPRARRARLTAVRIDPWSVMKTAFMLSIAGGIMIIVAVLVTWNVLNASGVFDSINATIADVLGSASTTPFDIHDYLGFDKVAGFTALLCVVDVVLITALATLVAFLYNLSASLLGGLEVTLAEEE